MLRAPARREATVLDATPVANVAAEPRRHYRIDPREHLRRFVHDARRRSLDVIGAYHSHPRSAAVPSATDAAEAFDRLHLPHRRPGASIRRKSAPGPGPAGTSPPCRSSVFSSRQACVWTALAFVNRFPTRGGKRAPTVSPFRTSSRRRCAPALGRAGPCARADWRGTVPAAAPGPVPAPVRGEGGGRTDCRTASGLSHDRVAGGAWAAASTIAAR